jgi:hypothetical protein
MGVHDNDNDDSDDDDDYDNDEDVDDDDDYVGGVPYSPGRRTPRRETCVDPHS